MKGLDIPALIEAFAAAGGMTPGVLDACSRKLVGKGIEWSCVDAGDNLAGSIQILVRSDTLAMQIRTVAVSVKGPDRQTEAGRRLCL